MYSVTKEFTGEILAGLTYTYVSHYPVRVGLLCKRPIGGSPYRIISCVRIS